MPIYFYNSLTRKKEEFKPLKKGRVGLYTCGPTVYDYPHLGNLLSYLVWDVLKRFLLSQGYKVTHVMNITDVGHLTSDADEGEDKLEAAGRRTGKKAWEIADYFLKVFLNNIHSFNILPPTKMMRATETIKEQIEFVKILEAKGYLYKTSDGLYFDTSKIKDYGRLANLSNMEIKEGARVAKNLAKKHPTDFAVWKFSPAEGQRDMEWESPWGLGFPGWHLECSVMSRLVLGDTFDIHTGGIDHLTIHHPNEMAQSEAVTGQQQANYWIHNAFMKIAGSKMSKSAGTFITLEDIKAKGFSPLAYRFLVLQNHYRQPLNFFWESLTAAQTGLLNLVKEIAGYDKPKGGCQELENKFYEALADDLNTSRGLAILQEVIDSSQPSGAKLKTIFKIDEVLGLDLANLREKILDLSGDVKVILEKRAEARQNKDWPESDRLRDKLTKLGIEVKDTDKGQKAIRAGLT
jgi:cysteinyl-tRNA synthetase